MRVVMMGSGPFAVPTLQAIVDAGSEVVEVVSRPLRAGSSRKKLPPHPVRALAEDLGLPTAAPENVNDPAVVQRLASLGADLFVVCDYGQILSSECLTAARLGGVNLHASLLPKYRGAAPINWAIYHGETTTGVTVIQMTPGLDAGPCLAQASTPIGADEDAAALESRLAEIGAEQVVSVLRDLATGAAKPIPQDKTQATKAPRLRKDQGEVDWRRSAEQIRNQIRAFVPWPRTATHWHKKAGAPLRLILVETAVEALAPQPNPSAQPGTVVDAGDDRLVVATGQGLLRLVRVQPAGKREMTARELLHGQAIRPGDRFGPLAAAGPSGAGQPA